MKHRLDPVLFISLLVIAFFVIAAISPALLAPGDPLAIDPLTGMSAPSAEHWLGTDESGRDVYTRIVWGTRDSLLIGASATLIGLGVGLLLGGLAALGGRRLDWIASRVIEVGFSFPGILLALLIMSLVGPGVGPAIVSVGLSTAPGYARVIRGVMRSVLGSMYVEADLVMGRNSWHRFTRTILPNTAASLFALATLGLGQAVVWASALAFLGLGAPPPSPEWGAMLAAGRTHLITGGWWLTVFPGTAIVLVALSATVVGRRLRNRARNRGAQ
ncbi:peptide/nickel transport system permease protein [Trueperella bonasi]|uniref:Peptide/nickel transport system permease protein n=1 Tax=Trueperella bonasi TaxID=312286 RepID=A0ABT9NFM3_9ACTO|nr:ABC transporter permease [Trueperella bonasi]MDP9805653.1 peptide/nickel transport system permease protein [Trueperella bonasi]